jgi:hypothetical protein
MSIRRTQQQAENLATSIKIAIHNGAFGSARSDTQKLGQLLDVLIRMLR